MHSELITQDHLARRALIYIRQSTAHQVLSNGESTRLQYALRQRAVDLGWHEADVEVIDQDLGESGTSAVNRSGFKDLLAQVGLGEAGIVLSYEVTRLTRNCSDWYPLLNPCGIVTASSPTVTASTIRPPAMGGSSSASRARCRRSRCKRYGGA